MDQSFEVEENERLVVFKDGMRETFRKITKVDAKGGQWLRVYTKTEFIIINPDNVNYIVVPLEAKVR